jgi:Flp pilus assembly pilin Flp
MLRGFIENNSGATAIEYALIAGFLSIVIIPSVVVLRVQLSESYERVAAILQ